MGGYVYQLEASINDIPATIYSRNGGSFNNSGGPGDTQVFIFDTILKRGDKLRLKTITNLVEYENFGTCYTSGREHECTFITGSLLQRKPDSFGWFLLFAVYK